MRRYAANVVRFLLGRRPLIADGRLVFEQQEFRNLRALLEAVRERWRKIKLMVLLDALDDRAAEERAAMMKALEERWEGRSEEEFRAFEAAIAWQCWDELSDEDKAIIPQPEMPRPIVL